MLLLNTVNQQIIKETNRARILKLIRAKKEITIKDIAKILGTSIPTVISNVNELINIGIVEEGGVAESSGGRKPVIIRMIPEARLSFGVDISPNKISIALMDLNATILEEKSSEYETNKSFEGILCITREIIESIIKKNNIKRDKILGIGFSLPGIVDEENLVLEIAPNINVKNFDFKPYEKFFGFPVYIENEANDAAIGEAELGISSHYNNLVFISITEGIGTGIIIQNHLYKSTSKRAGEFGHMRITDDAIKCNCGRTGCWELYASETALLKNYNDKSSSKVKTVSQFIGKVENEDSLACEVFNQYIRYLAVGIENVILTISPEKIIIGGKISKYHELYEKTLVEYINSESVLYPIDESIIGYSSLKGRASIIGAGLLPINQLIRTGAATL
ncbi:ArsR family transcriptional regulator [Vallitalea longa]|uniref:ArsR family transcriptional regulator n=1 Tax=Vallitalea longa TaxID=2936439 RepID=A0A9W5YBH6_9FIRM|nr:ROK family transcriptional regulator [Vallitalea longa]GKX29540.1 ArsR family transcriptional regulator [Vallitalea longa]